MLQAQDSSVLWLVVVGFIIAFVLAFGIGANDVANSFGTSVGSKVLTLYQACIIASIFELGGAVLIGSKVSDTVRKGIIDINQFAGKEELAMAGAFSALTGTSIWLLIATFFNLPVSGTHSIVGATIGYALVAFRGKGIKWVTFGKIAASWVVSPLLSGLISSIIFVIINKCILTSDNPLKRGLLFLPVLFAATIFINLFSIFYTSAGVFGMGGYSWYVIFGICAGCSAVIGLFIAVFVNPWLKKKILKWENADSITAAFSVSKTYSATTQEKEIESVGDETPGGRVYAVENKGFVNDTSEEDLNQSVVELKSDGADLLDREDGKERSLSVLNELMKPAVEEVRSNIKDDPYSARLFKYLQILTASFGAFAHGGNDVSNAIGPLISLWLIYQNGEVISKAATPIWILLYGGVGIIVGLCVWGRRVIKTIGENLSPITPSSGFAIEIGSALTVLLASNLGIPISTTHCKVGSVVIVGRVRSKQVVDWSLFGNIVVSWVITMPITGSISAAIFAILREVLY